MKHKIVSVMSQAILTPEEVKALRFWNPFFQSQWFCSWYICLDNDVIFFKCRKDISGDSDINCRSIYTFLEKKDITRVYRCYCYFHSEGSPPQEVVMLETDSLCLSLSRDKVVSTLLPTASLYESKYNVGDAWESLWSHQQSLVNTMQSRKM